MTWRWPSLVALAALGGCGFIGYDERIACAGDDLREPESDPASVGDAGATPDASGNGGGSPEGGTPHAPMEVGAEGARCSSVRPIREEVSELVHGSRATRGARL